MSVARDGALAGVDWTNQAETTPVRTVVTSRNKPSKRWARPQDGETRRRALTAFVGKKNPPLQKRYELYRNLSLRKHINCPIRAGFRP